MVDAIASLSSGAATAPVLTPQAAIAATADQTSATEPASTGRELTKKEMKSIVSELNKTMEGLGTKVTFSVDDKSRKPVIRIIDSVSKQVIFQMPPEGMLRAAQRMTHLLGMIVDQTN